MFFTESSVLILPLNVSEELLAAKSLMHQHLETHRTILNDLEELGDIMSEMLQREQEVEVSMAGFTSHGTIRQRELIS